MRVGKVLLRPADLAPLLGVGRSRVYQLLAERKIPSIRHGRSIRIPRDALEKWLATESDRAMAGLRPEPGKGADV